ncbi:MAG: NAD(P)H-hydrate dehydratase [Oscillospiraceae bacterium]|nr:NAD(P)H-hydrate dehydratase [Oscillospiraceae bacterium]
MRLSDSAKMRGADAEAINVRGIPSALLMRRAAGFIVSAVTELCPAGGTVWCFCGSGNNGGDGVAAAAQLLSRGYSVRALLTGSREHMTADTREMERRLREAGGALEDFDADAAGFAEELAQADVIVDAVFGIGLDRPPKGRALEAIRAMNSAPAKVVAADIASGVEADTGRILSEAVHADVTVTFSMAKPGHFAEPGCTCCGALRVEDIGIPTDILDGAGIDCFAVTDGEISLPARPRLSHKGSFGRVLIVGGSVGYTGAPCMCAAAAVRAGAGLVSLGVPERIYPMTAVKSDEAMPFPLPCDGAGRLGADCLPQLGEKLKNSDVCVLGPGLGRSAELGELARSLVGSAQCRMVIDADGLFALGSEPDCLRSAALPPVLTPHEGEFARLGGELTGDRCGDARRFAQKYNCVLVLKGHRTIAAFPDGEVYIITHGNAGMAKGGTGDVLAGVIGAMLGQFDLKRAVLTALHLHALAGDMCAEELGQYGMCPTDIIKMLPRAAKMLEEQGA